MAACEGCEWDWVIIDIEYERGGEGGGLKDLGRGDVFLGSCVGVLFTV